MQSTYSTILIDLDGTIVDSAPGITSSLAHTFWHLGLPVPSAEELIVYVGPPLLESFRAIAGFSESQSHEALTIYRQDYAATGVFNATVYPGVEDVLRAIHESGIPLALATSKPEYPAKLILEHFSLLKYFDVVTGASDDEVRSAKADVVAEALERLRAFGADLSAPVMVGDRSYDVHGAGEHDVPTIFVRWGYGPPAEEAGTIGVASTAAELQRLLGLQHGQLRKVEL